LLAAIMVPSSSNYAGDIGAAEAWERLKADPRAQVIDVRTLAEWNFVGLPDLSAVNRDVHCIEWQGFPSMAVNPGFVQQATQAVTKAGADRDTPIILMCRSGGRSRAAAMALAAAGFTAAFNLAGGFEGDLDPQGHRGELNGWKAAGLPWRQS
jgi:rhodanese-related sulfurtransferase